MKIGSLSRGLLIILSIFLMSSAVNAGKLKSSESYLKKLDKAIAPMNKNLDSLKSILNSIEASKSFVKTDFWGLQPAWYVKGSGAGVLTTSYPYSSKWLNKFDIWEKHSSGLVRNINGVVFTPINMRPNRKDPTGWSEKLYVDFDFSPGWRNSDAYKKYVLATFTSNGIPQSKIKSALAYFESKVEPVTKLFEDIFVRFDNLYRGYAKFGYLKGYENLAKRLDKKQQLNMDDYVTPNKHAKIFTEEVFQKFGGSLYVRSRKGLHGHTNNWAKKASLFHYYKNSYYLRVEVPLQYFQIAKGMSKSKRFNQLKKIKILLDKKVSTGKVKVSKSGKYTIYEDSIDKYTPGRIAIDFKSGMGYWQTPTWNDRKHYQYYFKKIKEDTEKINKVLVQYLSICLDETVKKFENTNSQTDDF